MSLLDGEADDWRAQRRAMLIRFELGGQGEIACFHAKRGHQHVDGEPRA